MNDLDRITFSSMVKDTFVWRISGLRFDFELIELFVSLGFLFQSSNVLSRCNATSLLALRITFLPKC